LKYKPECNFHIEQLLKNLFLKNNSLFAVLNLYVFLWDSDEELMDYFRAIIKSEEVSERTFELTGFVLS